MRESAGRSGMVAMVVTLASSLLLAAAHADVSGVTVSSVELMFLEGEYQDVIDSAAALIGSRSYRRDELYYLKGVSEMKTQRYAAARESFREIVCGYPSSARVFDASVGTGDTYLLEGNIPQAVRSYEETLAGFPEHKDRAVLYYRLSEAYAKSGDAGKSQYYFDSARLVAPLSFEPVVPCAVTPKELPGDPVAGLKQPSRKTEPSSTGRLSVQVGSFKSKSNADTCAVKLSRQGFESYIESADTADGTMYRVRVGKFRTQEDARATTTRLRSRGYAAKTCTDEVCE